MKFSRRLLLTGTLGAAFAAAAVTEVDFTRRHTVTQEFRETVAPDNYWGGFRAAQLTESDFFFGKYSGYKLYENGQQEVSSSKIRLFRDNAADVKEARQTVQNWMSAPGSPPPPPIPYFPF